MTAAYKSLKAAVYEALNAVKDNGLVIGSPEQATQGLLSYNGDVTSLMHELIADIVKEWQIEQEKTNGR